MGVAAGMSALQPRHQEPILVSSGESRSINLLHGQVDRLRSVSAADSSMLASQSSGCPRQRGQPSYRGQSLSDGRPWGAHRGLAPDRNARRARHSSRTSSWLTRDIDCPLSPVNRCRDRQRRLPRSGRAPSPGDKSGKRRPTGQTVHSVRAARGQGTLSPSCAAKARRAMSRTLTGGTRLSSSSQGRSGPTPSIATRLRRASART